MLWGRKRWIQAPSTVTSKLSDPGGPVPCLHLHRLKTTLCGGRRHSAQSPGSGAQSGLEAGVRAASP